MGDVTSDFMHLPKGELRDGYMCTGTKNEGLELLVSRNDLHVARCMHDVDVVAAVCCMGNVNDVAPRLVVDHEPDVSLSADRFVNLTLSPQR
jgi:hypothetical protein